MLHSLKPFQCPKCNASYSSKDAARYHNVTKFPRILTCSHSICESCLQSAEKNSKTIPCPTCKVIINLGDDDPSAKLLPDVHALGIISANMKNSLPCLKVKMVPSTEFKRQQSLDSLKKIGPSIICGNCNKHQAFWQCDECELNFCSLCFKEIHNDKSKKKHEGKKIFADLYNSMVQEGCPEHENKSVEFYCEIDDELTCSYCMLMGKHVGHQVKTLVDKNKSCADDLKNTLEDIAKMQKQLKYTDHRLCEIIPKEKVDISDTLTVVHDYFHKLHAALQTRESELMSEIIEISERKAKPLEEMRFRVTSYERDLASLKKDAESVIENPHLAVSAPAILKKIEENKNIPCHLVTLAEESEKEFDFNLNLQTEFEEQIKEIGQIHFGIKSRFALLPSNDLPEDYCTDIPESFSIKLQGFDNDSCCDSVETFSEDSLSVTADQSSNSSMQAAFKHRDFNRMQPEKVIVSHITSPSSFFVQRCCDIRKLKVMSEAIDKWCKGYETKRSKVVTLEPGNLYLVQYSADNRWYRGRVKSIVNPEDKLSKEFGNGQVIGIKSPIKTEDGKIVVKDKEVRAVVFYIDYGNTETVAISNVKNIQPRFLSLPGIAKECSLVDIEPVNGDTWSSESLTTFAKFVSNKPVIMQIFEERNNVYQVDLCQIADSEISYDVPVSVRDSLVFLELAVFPSGAVPTRKRKKNERNYMPPEPLRMNANICAIVSHVNDPDNFYVQQMSTASYLSKLIFEMNETYEADMNNMLHNIYAPHIGMVCAARFSLDKQWYRARVIGLPGGAQVKVQYVDFGNTEVIHHKFLRKLFDKFLKLNIQAIPCKLAQVSYNQAKGWSAEASKWLTDQVSRKQLIVKSLGMIPGENKAEILIYYIEDVFEVCVNALLVEEGFAISTGPFSKTPRKGKDGFVHKTHPLKTATSTLNEIIRPPIPPPVNVLNGLDDASYSENVKSPPRNTASNQQVENDTNSAPTMNSKRKYPSLAAPAEGINHIEVHVSHVITPGSFYIRLAGDNEKKLTLLMDDMQKVYLNLQGELVECSIGKSYAVFCTKKQKWFRGTVLEKFLDGKVKIHYVDYGNTEEVEKKYIRKLMEKFTEDQSFSVRCHLDGITPAGGSTKWSHSACDMFRQLVAPYEILLLSSKGELDKETNSLPADLLIEKLIRGGALEPTKIEYVSITEEILKNGYALPSRRKCNSLPDNKPEGISDCKSKETSDCKPEETSDCKSEEASDRKPEETSDIKSENDPKTTSNNLLPSTSAAVVKDEIPPPKEAELPPEEPTFQWKPAVPPLDPTFKGFVTNIGDDGSIHLHLVQNGAGQVETIAKALQFKYNKSKYTCLKKPPPIGEACIAKFTIDNNWYRAEVISVYPGKVKVNFVDYGNNEIVPLSYIRTDIIMRDFPRQCLECSLFGIGCDTDDKWDKDLLTFLHNQLVESEVTVEVQAAPDDRGRLQCLIQTASGINVAELLLSMGFDDPSADCSEIPENFPVTCNKTQDTFGKALHLREGDIYPVCVTQITSKYILYLQILKIPDPKDEYEAELNDTHDAFLQLIATLQERAEKFPLLENPMPGMPCCAKYSYDDNWYRCEVTDLAEDGAVVLYVDYGNSEKVPFDCLRQLEPQFLDFPILVHFCALHGVRPVGEEWSSEARDILVQSLLSTDRELFAKVVVPGEIAQVDLLAKTDEGKYKPAYEKLVEKNLIILEKSLEY